MMKFITAGKRPRYFGALTSVINYYDHDKSIYTNEKYLVLIQGVRIHL